MEKTRARKRSPKILGVQDLKTPYVTAQISSFGSHSGTFSLFLACGVKDGPSYLGEPQDLIQNLEKVVSEYLRKH